MTAIWIYIILICIRLVVGQQVPHALTTKKALGNSSVKHGIKKTCVQKINELCKRTNRQCIEITESRVDLNHWHILACCMESCVLDDKNSKHQLGNKTGSFQNGKKKDYAPQRLKYTNFVILNLIETNDTLTTIESYLETSEKYLESNNEVPMYKGNRNNLSEYCHCKRFDNYNIRTQLKTLKKDYTNIWWTFVFQKYIQIIVAVIVASSGFLMDGTLLYIITNYKGITDSKVILINIVICDIFALITVYPVHLIIFNGIYFESDILACHFLIMTSISSVRALCIIALCVQRLLSVMKFEQKLSFFNLGTCSKVFVLISFIWGPPVALLTVFLISAKFELVDVLVIGEAMKILLIVFLVVLPIMITATNYGIERKLRRYESEMPSESSDIQARFRSSKVINLMCLIFWLTHFPFPAILNMMISNLHSNDIYYLQLKYVSCLVHSLFCLNAFLVPLGQFIMNKSIRKLFMRHLFSCSRKSSK